MIRIIKGLYLYILHSLVLFFYRKEAEKFKNGDVYETQKKKLSDILSRNKDTAYGRKHNFSSLKDIIHFQKNIPVTCYEDYGAYIREIMAGKENILTAEKVRMFALTSGSSSASKLIPYTESLKEEFQSGIKVWLYSLYRKYPKLKWGKSYWSITPLSDFETKESVIPIGFEDDREYFGKLEKYVTDLLFVSPKDIRRERDMDTFYKKTITALLKERDIRLFSFWSPSMLILLMEYLDENKEDILKDFSSKERDEIVTCIKRKEYSGIWKNLAVISCWGNSTSEAHLEKIRVMFPYTSIEEKGLLATEAFISFPYDIHYNLTYSDGKYYNSLKHDNNKPDKSKVQRQPFALSYRSHFFEFICEEDNRIYDVSGVEAGKYYEILVTTGGGLYRYNLGDIVKVTSVVKGLPYIQFIGRKGNVSDLYGEKLNEIFLKEAIESLIEENKMEYYMFAPDKDKYILYLKSAISLKAESLDNKLRENFHYDYCRKLGQLKMIRIFILTGNPVKEYTDFCLKNGQKLGNIKIRHLSSKDGWDKIYTGHFKGEENTI